MEEKTIVVNSIIGHGTTYQGDLECIDLLRIDGNFSGTARSHDVILIGEHGRVKGTLIAPRIVIAGMFHGVIKQCKLVMLQSSALVLGQLDINDIIVESGALASVKMNTLPSGERLKQLAYQETEDNNNNNDTATEHVNVRITGKYTTKILEKLFKK